MEDSQGQKPTSAEGKSQIIIGRGGWILYDDPRLKAEVRLRIVPDRDGELRVASLHLEAAKGIDGTLLRDIQLGQILARLRASPQACLWIAQQVRRQGEEVVGKAQELDEFLVTRQDLEAPSAPVDFTALSALLTQYPGRAKRPDGFYAEVARVFVGLSATSQHPAQELARHLGVPTSTVHRWVKESRRRGLFGPAAVESEE